MGHQHSSSPRFFLVLVVVACAFVAHGQPVPEITQQPESQFVQLGSNVVFQVAAVGQEPLTYQWRRNNPPSTDWFSVSDDARFNGSQTPTLTISGSQLSDQGNYRVLVYDRQLDLTYSDTVTLTTVYPPSITLHPTNRTVFVGETVQFVSAATGTAPMTYRWQFNGVDIPGTEQTTGPATYTLTYPNAQLEGAGDYRMVVTNAYGTAVSSNATLAAQSVASLPFTDGFESGDFSSHWIITGTGTYRSQVTSLHSPHGGVYHVTMDSSASGGFARNELTLGLDLAGRSGVVLTFWARSFGDEAHGPPPSPFVGGADFDGVAISADGTNWYEVQSLRGMSTSSDTEFIVDLDAAVTSLGLAYNSTFRVRFNQYDNYPINSLDGIAIDDISVTGFIPGDLDHFELSTVTSPQAAGWPFPLTITAQDGGGGLVTDFTGTVQLSGVVSNSTPSSTILGSPSWEVGANGPVTAGYSFTPSTSLTVTHFRSYSPGKVSLWTDSGTLLASEVLEGADRVWSETALQVPVVLDAGQTYRVGLYVTATNHYYYRNSQGPYTFAHGTIDHQYSYPGDGFPTNTSIDAYWPFVGLQYVPGQSLIPIIPAVTSAFTNGVWSGNVTVTQTVAEVRLHADDGTNHVGEGDPFAVLTANDLVLTADVSADLAPLGSDLVYNLQVVNPGPADATGVVLTNEFPPDATLISSTNSQGSSTLDGSTLVSTLGSISPGGSAHVSLTIKPTAPGLHTNRVTVVKNGVDPNPTNNSAQLVTEVLTAGLLSVTPDSGLNSTGIIVGPFFPAQQVYVLSNVGSAALTWTCESSASWITRSQPSGMMAPGESVSVTVSINSQANSLPPGNHVVLVSFTNLTSGFGSTSRLVSLTVLSNNVPVPNPQTVSTDEDVPVTVTLDGTDGDGDLLTAIISALPSVGQLYQTTNGTTLGAPILAVPTPVSSALRQVIYFPNTNQNGVGLDTFGFRLNDGRNNSAAAIVTIDVAPVADPPQAVPDEVAALPGQTTPVFDVLTNDLDPDGDFLSLIDYSDPTYGSVVDLGGGLFRYTPPPELVKGTDEFQYVIDDGSGRTATGVVTVVVGYLLGGDWTTLGNGPQRTGYYPAVVGTNVFTPYWTATPGGNVGQVVVAQGAVYLTTSQFVLAALDAHSGQEVWRAAFPSGFSMNPPTYDNGRIYFQRGNHSADSQLRCVDAANGEVQWSSPFSQQWFSYWAPLVVNDGVWVPGGYFGGMYGFDASDGTERFFDYYGGNYYDWTPTYLNAVVYSWVAGKFRAVDPESGALLWSLTLPWSWPSTYSIGTAIAAHKNRAFVNGNSSLHAINLVGHYKVWTATAAFRGTPAVANDVVYAIVAAGTHTEVHGYDFGAGSRVTTFVATNDSGVNGQPIVTDDALIVSSSGKTHVFDLQTQQRLQTIPYGGRVSVSEGTLFIANGQTLRAYGLGPAIPPNDLALEISVRSANSAVGHPLTNIIVVTNSGPASASDVFVTNAFPTHANVISASPSQGTWSDSPGQVVWHLGSLPGGGTATLEVVVVPQQDGTLIQSAQVIRSGVDANMLNNTVQIGTPILVPISIADLQLQEGPVGTNVAVLNVRLGAASSETITVKYATASDSALPGTEYDAQSGTLTFLPGITNQPIAITIHGDAVVESDEVFLVNLSSPANAVIVDSQGAVTLINDDGVPGQLHWFEWSTVASPQYRDAPFAATVVARDISNAVVTNLSGPVTVRLGLGGYNFDFENVDLDPWSPLNVGNPPGPYDLVRFDVGGNGESSQAVRLAPDNGGNDGVTQDIWLQAGVPYAFDLDLAVNHAGSGVNAGVQWGRLSVGGAPLVTTNFGSISPDEVQWRHVQEVYVPVTNGNHTVTINFHRLYTQISLWAYADNLSVMLPASPTYYLPQNITLTNGVWSGMITPMHGGPNLVLMADDGAGHRGSSTVFAVLTNDAPVADPQTLLVIEDTPAPITLTGSDPDDDLLVFSVPVPPVHGVLSGAGSNLVYQPNSNYFGPDEFTFRVDDGKGRQSDALVRITVAQVGDVSAPQLSVQAPGGNPQLVLLGEPYEQFGIQASTDLVHWITVTNLIPTNGPLQFIDPEAHLFNHRFYRFEWMVTPPELGPPQWSSNHAFGFDFATDIGRNYSILGSSNLIDWIILTNVTATGSNMWFTDPDASMYSRRFYQVRFE